MDMVYEVPERVGSLRYPPLQARVLGALRDDGRWEGFIAFGAENAHLVTPVETTQSTLADLVHWAGTLTRTYLEGALSRAMDQAPRTTARRRA
jgi:hypothetical protein